MEFEVQQCSLEQELEINNDFKFTCRNHSDYHVSNRVNHLEDILERCPRGLDTRTLVVKKLQYFRAIQQFVENIVGFCRDPETLFVTLSVMDIGYSSSYLFRTYDKLWLRAYRDITLNSDDDELQAIVVMENADRFEQRTAFHLHALVNSSSGAPDDLLERFNGFLDRQLSRTKTTVLKNGVSKTTTKRPKISNAQGVPIIDDYDVVRVRDLTDQNFSSLTEAQRNRYNDKLQAGVSFNPEKLANYILKNAFLLNPSSEHELLDGIYSLHPGGLEPFTLQKGG